MTSRFVANSEKCRKYTSLGGSAQIISKLHRGGYRNLLQYYNVCGGSLWTANLNYVIHGRCHKENLDDLLNFVPETTKRHIKTLAYFRMSGIDIIILCQLRELALMSSFSGIERGQCYLFWILFRVFILKMGQDAWFPTDRVSFISIPYLYLSPHLFMV